MKRRLFLQEGITDDFQKSPAGQRVKKCFDWLGTALALLPDGTILQSDNYEGLSDRLFTMSCRRHPRMLVDTREGGVVVHQLCLDYVSKHRKWSRPEIHNRLQAKPAPPVSTDTQAADFQILWPDNVWKIVSYKASEPQAERFRARLQELSVAG